jgi:hypothetical protein
MEALDVALDSMLDLPYSDFSRYLASAECSLVVSAAQKTLTILRSNEEPQD